MHTDSGIHQSLRLPQWRENTHRGHTQAAQKMVKVAPAIAFRGRHSTMIMLPKGTDSITPGHDLLLPAGAGGHRTGRGHGQEPSMVAGTETFYQPPTEEQCVLLLSPPHTYICSCCHKTPESPDTHSCFARTTWEPAGSHCLGLSQSTRTNPGSSCPRPERDLLLYMLRDIVLWVLLETVLLCSPG